MNITAKSIPWPMLCPADSFFRSAKLGGIVPWHDDDDDGSSGDDKPKRPKIEIATRPTWEIDADTYPDEKNPYTPLPTKWHTSLSATLGFSVRVKPPSTTAGKILLHCKARKQTKHQVQVSLIKATNFQFPHRIPSPPKNTNTQEQIHQVRLKYGGEQLAVFKIGITQSLELRAQYYFEGNFREMRCIHASHSLAQIETLEACLIDYFKEKAPVQCRNILAGGEGMRYKNGKPRNPPPFFLYVVAANASQAKRIAG